MTSLFKIVGMMSLDKWKCCRNFNQKMKMFAVQQIWNNLCLSVERDLFSGWKLQGIWIPPGLYTIWVFPIIFYSNNFFGKFNNAGHHQTTLYFRVIQTWISSVCLCSAVFYFPLWIKNKINKVVILFSLKVK